MGTHTINSIHKFLYTPQRKDQVKRCSQESSHKFKLQNGTVLGEWEVCVVDTLTIFQTTPLQNILQNQMEMEAIW